MRSFRLASTQIFLGWKLEKKLGFMLVNQDKKIRWPTWKNLGRCYPKEILGYTLQITSEGAVQIKRAIVQIFWYSILICNTKIVHIVCILVSWKKCVSQNSCKLDCTTQKIQIATFMHSSDKNHNSEDYVSGNCVTLRTTSVFGHRKQWNRSLCEAEADDKSERGFRNRMLQHQHAPLHGLIPLGQ